MRLSIRHQYLMILLGILLLVFSTQQKTDIGSTYAWRNLAEATVWTPLQQLDQPQGAVIQRFNPPVFRWPAHLLSFPVVSNSSITFSNASFMTSRHCVCIPLRL